MKHVTTVWFLMLLSPAVAQSVSVSVTTATQVTASVSSFTSGTSLNEVLPANTSVNLYQVNSSVAGAEAFSRWDAFATSGEARAEWRQTCRSAMGSSTSG